MNEYKELNEIIQRTRQFYDININDPETCKKCLEVNRDIIFSSLEKDFYDFPIIFKNIGIPNLTHYATILIKNDQIFLVDATYPQFFNTTITLDDNKTTQGLNNYLTTPQEQRFKEELITNGFVPATKENIIYYIKGFVNSLNNQNYNLNIDSIYNNINNNLPINSKNKTL